nr:molybdopterin-binding protein [Streptomyces mashuensis]
MTAVAAVGHPAAPTGGIAAAAASGAEPADATNAARAAAVPAGDQAASGAAGAVCPHGQAAVGPAAGGPAGAVAGGPATATDSAAAPGAAGMPGADDQPTAVAIGHPAAPTGGLVGASTNTPSSAAATATGATAAPEAADAPGAPTAPAAPTGGLTGAPTNTPSSAAATATGAPAAASTAVSPTGPPTPLLAGSPSVAPLPDGAAVRIATGARVPPGATAVLRSEHGTVRMGTELYAGRHVDQGQDIRPRGQECRVGDELLGAGGVVSPVVLGLAAAAGYDELEVVPRPRVEVFVLGDELLHEGLPRDGRIRDALGPLLGPWLTALGADVVGVRRLGDDAGALGAALAGSGADVVVTTGGTAAGPVDHVHPTLRRLRAELLVDGVAVRPGHPMLLARLGPRRHLVGLPGNPLAAVAGLLTLAEPLLRSLSGRPRTEPPLARLTDEVTGHPADTRLVPVARTRTGRARPLRFHGPAMLRGLAAADALAVVPPGGASPGTEVALLPFPWCTP